MNFSATYLPASRLAAGICRQPENISEKALALSTIGRNRTKRLSSKDWEDLKPTIKTRYVDQQHTIKDLARWIYVVYQVEPSKKQLTYHLSKWGFEKNTKQLEANRLLQEKLIPTFHRGRQITSAKLARWRRRASGSERVYKKKKIDTKDEYQSIHPSTPSTIKGFSSVSPTSLTDIISAFTIDPCSLLDVSLRHNGSNTCAGVTVDETGSSYLEIKDPSHSVAQDDRGLFRNIRSSSEPEIYARILDWSRSNFDYEVYPFSTSERCFQHRSQSRFRVYSAPNTTLEESCSMMLQSVETMEQSKALSLAESIEEIAYNYFLKGDYNCAQIWYNEIFTLLKTRADFAVGQIITASLLIITCMRLNCKKKQALSLQRDRHEQYLQFTTSASPLSINFWKKYSDLHLDALDDPEICDTIRLLLQISLEKLGPHDKITIGVFATLSFCQYQQMKDMQSEDMLRTTLQLTAKSNMANENAVDVAHTQLILLGLAKALDGRGKKEDGEHVMEVARTRYREAKCTGWWDGDEKHLAFKRTKLSKGEIATDEDVLREILKKEDVIREKDPWFIYRTQKQLAMILEKKGKSQEAAIWMERSLKGYIYDLDHFTCWSAISFSMNPGSCSLVSVG